MPKTQGVEVVAGAAVNPYNLYGYIGFGNNRRRRTKATKRSCNNKNSSCNDNEKEKEKGIGITPSSSPASLTMREHGSCKEEGQKIVTSKKKKGIITVMEVVVHDEIIYISDHSYEEEEDEDEGWSRKRPRSRSLKSLM